MSCSGVRKGVMQWDEEGKDVMQWCEEVKGVMQCGEDGCRAVG